MLKMYSIKRFIQLKLIHKRIHKLDDISKLKITELEVLFSQLPLTPLMTKNVVHLKILHIFMYDIPVTLIPSLRT